MIPPGQKLRKAGAGYNGVVVPRRRRRDPRALPLENAFLFRDSKVSLKQYQGHSGFKQAV